MNYYELVFTYTTLIKTNIINDILAAELGEIDFESFSETDNGIQAYIQEKLYNEQKLSEKLATFPLDNTTINYTKKLIIGKDWNEEWEKNYFKPIRIDKKCIIHASFHKPEKGFDYQILIDPKMAFGTGNHETTYLMINEMLKLELTQKSLLDMGCGTAVLAILSKLKGAERVVAIDIDEWAFENAIENTRLNHTENIDVALGGAELIANYEPFDFIFANINRNILLNDIQYYSEKLKAGGLLYLSGFYENDIPVIEKECNINGLAISSYTTKNNWVAIKAYK